GDEPECREQGDVRCEGDEEGEGAETGDAADDLPPTSDPVDHRPGQHRPETDSDEAERGHKGGCLGCESEGLSGQQLGDDCAEDDEVEALEGDGEPAQDGGPSAHRVGGGGGWGRGS